MQYIFACSNIFHVFLMLCDRILVLTFSYFLFHHRVLGILIIGSGKLQGRAGIYDYVAKPPKIIHISVAQHRVFLILFIYILREVFGSQNIHRLTLTFILKNIHKIYKLNNITNLISNLCSYGRYKIKTMSVVMMTPQVTNLTTHIACSLNSTFYMLLVNKINCLTKI